MGSRAEYRLFAGSASNSAGAPAPHKHPCKWTQKNKAKKQAAAVTHRKKDTKNAMDDAARRDVADVVDSVPCWMAVALLTLADVVLFAWQLLPGTNAAEAQWLRGLELAINALFVCELGLRFVAAGGDFLSSTMNVFDTVVIVCAFVLCLAEFTAAPIVALRGLRILRYVCRGVRGACAASRIDAGFEMRGLVRQNSLSRGATLMVFMRRPFCVLRVASTASSSNASPRRRHRLTRRRAASRTARARPTSRRSTWI